ncbi:hypothetical protein [Saccharothrix obliqua]|uniref:hypothetical protein n=1 Tax=Saccharothrix obliqua TaxID=2861747 RepID=UPI001C5CCBC7|nr:hypothetical protein [Saccharothrix obliqua]MBW4719664.1 hypothetical protein [Saccharothrix obliqua]
MIRTALAVALLLLTMAACGTAPTETGRPTMPTKSGTGELRTDLEPLTKRFPLLSAAEKAEWMSGTLGDGRVPGPSTFWIDAVVTLPESTLARLDKDTRETTTPPEVVSGLRDHLPRGPYLTGGSLDEAFTTPTWSATAYLAKNTNTVILVALGE